MVVVKVENGHPIIEGRMCSYGDDQVRSEILSFSEVNEVFILPKKYIYVITELNFAKIIKVDFNKITEISKTLIRTELQLLLEGTNTIEDTMEEIVGYIRYRDEELKIYGPKKETEMCSCLQSLIDRKVINGGDAAKQEGFEMGWNKAVGCRRELLISFGEYLKERDIITTKKENIPVRVDLFLKRN